MLATVLCASALAAPEPKRIELAVGDVTREALVYTPAAVAPAGGARLVVAFHGHGGTMKSAAAAFALHTHLPDAVVVYPQGLPTPGKLTDPGGKRAGWQHSPGEQADRDLKFFDVLVAAVRKEYAIDARRVYATGHSNGGRFTYLLWAARGDVLAAVAPSGTPVGLLLRDAKPKPCLHVAGEADELVSFESQKRTADAVRRLNGCAAEGRPWATAGPLVGTEYPSGGGTPFVWLVHPGGHAYPADAPKLVAKFFRQHPAA